MKTWVLILVLTYPPPERGPYGPVMIARGPLTSLEECLRLKPIEEHKIWPGVKVDSWCVPLGGVNG